MGITTITQEFTTSIPPSRMFKAIILDAHNLIPKIMPQAIKSVEFIEGDGGVGSIKQTNFAEGSQYKYMKHKIDALDTTNCESKYTMIEGDLLGDKLESIVYEVKFEASDAGCVCKVITHFHSKGDIVLTEGHIKYAKEKSMGMYKLVEEYLLANPDTYC